MDNNSNCLICGCPCHSEIPMPFGEVSTSKNSIDCHIYCNDCGAVYIAPMLFAHIDEEKDTYCSDMLFKMACLLYEKRLQGKTDCIAFYSKKRGNLSEYNYSFYDYEDWVKSFPADPLEKIDRALINIKNFLGTDFNKTLNVIFPRFESYCSSPQNSSKSQLRALYSTKILFCKDDACHVLVNLICEMGYAEQKTIWGVQEVTSSGQRIRSKFGLSLRITAKGWQRISELRDQQTENSETCFVAMAFNESTILYREAVRKAVEQAGYRPDGIAVDEVHHNSFIMDKVINLINEARFVIADFTTLQEEVDEDEKKVKNGVRGGVYWEAGYARGLKKEVVHTCRDDVETLRRLHFDVQQINTLRWKEETLDDFTNNLRERIKATVGKGPLPID